MIRATFAALVVAAAAATPLPVAGPTLEVTGAGVAGGAPDRLYVAVEVGVRGDAPRGTAITKADVDRAVAALVAGGIDRRTLAATIAQPDPGWLARSPIAPHQAYGLITFVVQRPARGTLDALENRVILPALQPLRTAATYAQYKGGWYQRDDCESLRRAAHADGIARSRSGADGLAASSGSRVVAAVRVEETSALQPELPPGFLCGRAARPDIPPPGFAYVDPMPRMSDGPQLPPGAFVVYDTVRVTWSVALDPNAVLPSLPPTLTSFNRGVYGPSPPPLTRGVVRTSAAVSSADVATRGDCFTGGATPYAIALAERYARTLADIAQLHLERRAQVVDHTVTANGCPPPKFPVAPVGGSVTVTFDARPIGAVPPDARVVEGTATVPLTLPADRGRFELALSQNFSKTPDTYPDEPLPPDVTTNAVAALAAAFGVPSRSIQTASSGMRTGRPGGPFGRLYRVSLVTVVEHPTPQQAARFETAAHDLATRYGLQPIEAVAYAMDDCLVVHDRIVAAAFAAAREAATAQAGHPVGTPIAAEETGALNLGTCGPGVLQHFELQYAADALAPPTVTARTTVHALFAEH